MRTEINGQLRHLTLLLVRKGFSIHQNWPEFLSEQNMIVWTKFKNLSFVLKDEPYIKIYEECLKNLDYNFLLLDGGIVQMKYSFSGSNELIGHILLYFPHYDFLKYEDSPDEYENRFFGQTLFSDIFESRNVTFPLRMDFGSEHRDIVHPRIHATLGNCTTCRIPVSKPLSPIRFVSFILRNFYFSKYVETNIETDLRDDIEFDEQITENERKLVHFDFTTDTIQSSAPKPAIKNDMKRKKKTAAEEKIKYGRCFTYRKQ